MLMGKDVDPPYILVSGTGQFAILTLIYAHRGEFSFDFEYLLEWHASK